MKIQYGERKRDRMKMKWDIYVELSSFAFWGRSCELCA